MSAPPVTTASPNGHENNVDLEVAKSAAPSPTKPSYRQRLKPGFSDQPTFRESFKSSWFDILTQLTCVLCAYLIYLFAKPLLPHQLPLYPGIYTSAWGLKHGRPYTAEYIDTTVSAVVSFAGPFLIIGAIGLWKVRSFWDTQAALMGLGYALATATLFQAFLKWIIGGLRPHFLSLCNAPLPPHFAGTGPQGIWYNPEEVCHADEKKLREAMMSFPSGHSCGAFAGFGFLGLYLNAKFGIFAHRAKEGNDDQLRRTHHWKLVLFVAPLLLAMIIAASKVRDGWHHPIDVIAGGLIGSAFALMAYKMVYRGVWHQDKNHVPMV